jgi:hypothetical protein
MPLMRLRADNFALPKAAANNPRNAKTIGVPGYELPIGPVITHPQKVCRSLYPLAAIGTV